MISLGAPRSSPWKALHILLFLLSGDFLFFLALLSRGWGEALLVTVHLVTVLVHSSETTFVTAMRTLTRIPSARQQRGPLPWGQDLSCGSFVLSHHLLAHAPFPSAPLLTGDAITTREQEVTPSKRQTHFCPSMDAIFIKVNRTQFEGSVLKHVSYGM